MILQFVNGQTVVVKSLLQLKIVFVEYLKRLYVYNMQNIIGFIKLSYMKYGDDAWAAALVWLRPWLPVFIDNQNYRNN